MCTKSDYLFGESKSQFSSVQSLSCVWLFATPWIAARAQASQSITNSRSSLRLTSIESVMPSSHLILCRPLLIMYSAYKLNKQGDNIQPWRVPFPIWNQSVVPCLVLTVASWEMQIKTTMQYHLILVRMANIKKSINNKCWKGCGEKVNLLHYWSECKLTQTLWRTVSVQFSSVAQSCMTLCDPMDCSTPGFSVHHQLPELS